MCAFVCVWKKGCTVFKNLYWISTSNHEVTETRFVSLPKHPPPNLKRKVFKTLAIRQQSDLWEIGNEQGEHCSCAAFYLEFPGCSIGRGTEMDSGRLSNLRRWR